MELNIKHETIIICNDNYKRNLLKQFNETTSLYQVHFMSLNEFKKKYYFDYNYKTILYLMNKYNYKYEVAKIYLDNMYYVSDNEYESDKLNLLVKLKKELNDNDLLIYDEYFRNYIKDKDIIVYKCDLDKFFSNIFDSINAKIINKKYNDYKHKVYKFDTLDEEVEYISYKICELIMNGVDINKIKLANVSDEYINVIERYFKMYNIPVNLNKKIPIYSTNIARLFIDNYSSNIKDTIDILKKYEGNDIYNKIIDICNKYDEVDYLNVKEIIIHDLKHTYLDNIRYENAIEIIDYKDNDIKDEYVFLVGFNLGSIPVIYKDEDYITDNLKENLNLDYTVEKNRREKDITLNSIHNIKNLVITYKLKDSSNVYNPSTLLPLFEEETDAIDLHKSYSIINDKLKLTNRLDNLIKYGSKADDISILNNNYDIPYMKYNNRFKGLDSKKLNEFLDNKLSLSYTSMDLYNKCAFRYYLSNILKLNLYEETFYTLIGSLFHHVLEVCLKEDKDIYDEVDNYLKDRELSNKETFYINKLKEELTFIINTIKEQMKLCKLDNILTEEKITIEKDSNLKVTFTGLIDKILYKEIDNKTVVALIDYKTGNPDINLEYFPYGLNMQLPIYLYLASNSTLKNVSFAGFYLQKIILPTPNIDKKKSLEEKKKEHLKLEGYSTTNFNNLSLFDISCKDSEVVKSLKVKNDGTFYAYSKVLTDEQINKIIDLTDKQIDKTINNIEQAKFDINPKRDVDNIIGCNYCPYKDICYKTKKDEVYIKADKTLEFLGGDNNE